MVKTRSSARLASAAPTPTSQDSSDKEDTPIETYKRLRPKKTFNKKTSAVPPTPVVAPVAPVSVINYTSSAAGPAPTLPPLSHVPTPHALAPHPRPSVDVSSRGSEYAQPTHPVHGGNYMLDALKAGGGYPVHPDVRFRRLPFYHESAEIMRPSTLVPMFSTRMQESTFYFHLTPQQAQTIMNSPEVNSVQVQLRFCMVETSCEQDDCFPPSCSVKINNKLCPLPMPIPTNKCGVEPKRPPGPVNITALLKLSPTVANTIVVSWGTDFMCRYAVCVSLVRRLTPALLLSRLKNKGTKNPDFTRSLIKEKLREDLDCEIATTSLRVSLVCPLGKMRMVCPCRPVTCLHLQCFDASLFLLMNERKPSWVCPVCDKPALYDSLVVDGYFQEVLNSSRLAEDCTEIQLHKDGSWSAHTKTDIIPEKIFNDIEVIQDDMDVIPLSDGSDSSTGLPSLSKRAACSREGFPDQPSPRPVASTAPPTTTGATVDLTSDSEDDLPLRRKVPRPAEMQNNAESSNEAFTNIQRNRSLDLAVSSIISLDSPSPLTLPASPSMDYNDPPMEIESLDPTLDLDDPDETNEALKQISSTELQIEIEVPKLPESAYEIAAPMEFSSEAVRPSEITKDELAEDPIEVNTSEEHSNNIPPKEEEENNKMQLNKEPSDAVLPADIKTPECVSQMELSENPIDIVNAPSTEMHMLDPLEIEEPMSNITGEVSSSEAFDDNDDSIDFLKDTINNSLGKTDEFYSQEISILPNDPFREEGSVPVESRNIPQAIVAPYQPDPEPQYDFPQSAEP